MAAEKILKATSTNMRQIRLDTGKCHSYFRTVFLIQAVVSGKKHAGKVVRKIAKSAVPGFAGRDWRVCQERDRDTGVFPEITRDLSVTQRKHSDLWLQEHETTAQNCFV
ncbi:MAG: hypothetical protein JZU72_03400 [Chlorobium phaeobacteroides]|nr:hypothetical protein [Chlorobium phaeobacteroides]